MDIDRLVRGGFSPAQAKALVDALSSLNSEPKPEVEALSRIGVADAKDADGAIALANACKARLNAVIDALKA